MANTTGLRVLRCYLRRLSRLPFGPKHKNIGIQIYQVSSQKRGGGAEVTEREFVQKQNVPLAPERTVRLPPWKQPRPRLGLRNEVAAQPIMGTSMAPPTKGQSPHTRAILSTSEPL